MPWREGPTIHLDVTELAVAILEGFTGGLRPPGLQSPEVLQRLDDDTRGKLIAAAQSVQIHVACQCAAAGLPIPTGGPQVATGRA